MSTNVPVFKDNDSQRPIPSAWRKTFSEIVDAFKDGDYELKRGVPRVNRISSRDAYLISGAIRDYGATLVSLPEETWETSACQWMQGYWDILVDLFTTEEGASDLALAIRAHESGGVYCFDIHSIYVP